MGVQFQCQSVMGNGFFCLAHVPVVGSDIGIIDGRTGVQPKDLSETLNGLFMFLEFEITETHEVVNIGSVLVMGLPLFKDIKGLFVLSQVLQAYSHI